MNEIARLLAAAAAGDRHAPEQLLPLVYDELRALAAQRLALEKPGQTLQATALVHEAYLRLVGSEQGQHWNSIGHFFAAAAEAMRRILIDNARRKQRIKHGGGRQRLALDELSLSLDSPDDELLALDEALTDLANAAPAKAKLVELRFFAGLSLEDAAAVLDISQATAKRYWAFARAWLYATLSGTSPGQVE
jgi:RNA polymerase sigma factor (TIGR02999 family)